MRHGSLFSGIGGFDLAAEWMVWENKFHCEWNEFGQQVLKYYWPDAEQFTDITKSDFTKYANRIDILTGGFPCQPYSTAGKRLGKEDERHLWPEMLRAIREIQPRWVVGENVSGLISWNGGMVFEEVQADLEAEGYEVIPFILPACGVNAPHRRDRVWFIAHLSHSQRTGLEGGRGQREGFKPGCEEDGGAAKNSMLDGCLFGESNQDGAEVWELRDTGTGDHEWFHQQPDAWASPNTGGIESQGGMHTDGTGEAKRYISPRSTWIDTSGTWDNFPTQSPLCSGDDGLPTQLDGITFSKWRNESIKGYGNAVVPQVVYQIFKAIQSYDTTETIS